MSFSTPRSLASLDCFKRPTECCGPSRGAREIESSFRSADSGQPSLPAATRRICRHRIFSTPPPPPPVRASSSSSPPSMGDGPLPVSIRIIRDRAREALIELIRSRSYSSYSGQNFSDSASVRSMFCATSSFLSAFTLSNRICIFVVSVRCLGAAALVGSPPARYR